jgi:ribosomal-protein-alanine N-acetyltransferase
MGKHVKEWRETSLVKENNQHTSMGEIETTRLILHRPAGGDMLILRNLWRDERVRYYLGGVVSQEVLEGKIASLQQHWEAYGYGQWAICEKQTSQIIGLCGLERSEEGIELSYMFFPTFWGRGLATEAVSVSLDYGFCRLSFERIVAITQEANHASCQLLEKVGMKHTNTLRRWNAVQRFYELTRAEWLAREKPTRI